MATKAGRQIINRRRAKGELNLALRRPYGPSVIYN